MPMAIPKRHRKQSGIWKFGCQFWTIFLLPTCFEVEKKIGLNRVKGYNQSTSTIQPILGDADTCFICCDSIWFNFENSREKWKHVFYIVALCKPPCAQLGTWICSAAVRGRIIVLHAKSEPTTPFFCNIMWWKKYAYIAWTAHTCVMILW